MNRITQEIRHGLWRDPATNARRLKAQLIASRQVTRSYRTEACLRLVFASEHHHDDWFSPSTDSVSEILAWMEGGDA